MSPVSFIAASEDKRKVWTGTPSRLHSLWFDVGGINIHCLAEGSRGQPVVILHGGGFDAAGLSFRKTIPVFAGRHRVFAPDWPRASTCIRKERNKRTKSVHPDEPYRYLELGNSFQIAVKPSHFAWLSIQCEVLDTSKEELIDSALQEWLPRNHPMLSVLGASAVVEMALSDFILCYREEFIPLDDVEEQGT